MRKMHLWDFSSDIFSTPTFKNRGGCFQHFYVLIIVQIKISACHHFKVKSFNEMCYLCKWVRFWVLRNPFFFQYLSSLPGVWLIAWLRLWSVNFEYTKLQGVPHLPDFTIADPTNAIFSLCTRKCFFAFFQVPNAA